MSTDTCYICYEEEDRTNKFYDTQCGCTGSIKIHRKCFENILIHSGSCDCPICKRTMIDICIYSGQRIVYSKISNRDDMVAKYTINDQGRKHGVYYEIDKITRENRTMIEYENGLMNGEMNIWGPGGSLRVQATWVRGKRHGAFYEWDEDVFKGYTEVIYFQDQLIEYSRYNYSQEKVDYEYYGYDSMNKLAAEIDSALWDDITVS